MFTLPPNILSYRGEKRKVGFELEFGGVPLLTTCEIIQALFGGKIIEKNRFAFLVEKSSFGDFAVESDARFLSEKRYEAYLERIGLSTPGIVQSVERFLSENLAGKYLPFEIAMPPLPIDDLYGAEKIREKLFENAAKGTRASLFTAFGMQINPEVESLEAERIVCYLKSFFILLEWLQQESAISLTRQLAPYIHPFPQVYVDLVTSKNYHPDLKTLMTDYLQFSPTRNRPLDLLPLFTFIDEETVFRFPVEKDKIKARPTFHYRLPNSDIDNPQWSLASEWNKWVQVEILANNPQKLTTLSDQYNRLKKDHLVFPRSDWIKITSESLDVAI